MKNKPNYWYKQSAVIPFRKSGELLEILLITSRKKKKWIFPKGIIEIGLTSKESAEKEAFEEAGIKGKILPKKIGNYSYKKWGSKCKVKVFAMQVTMELREWEEDFRERRWTNISNIENYIKNRNIIKIVNKLRLQLEE